MPRASQTSGCDATDPKRTESGLKSRSAADPGALRVLLFGGSIEGRQQLAFLNVS
jgi:hypothetical protein